MNFYNNGTSSLTRIMNNPSILNTLQIGLITNYEFQETHSMGDINISLLVSKPLSNITILNKTDFIVLDADDISFDVSYNSKINGLLFFTNGLPLFYVKSYRALPLTLKSNNITLNFSNSLNKIAKFTEQVSIAGPTLFIQNNVIRSIDKPSMIERSANVLSFAEDVSKVAATGKYSTYRDISITCNAHPLTGDVVTLTDSAAINQSLKNILLANTYDRPFSSKNIAGNINAFLFNFSDDITHSELKTGLSIAINNNEPRITLMDIRISGEPETYSLNVTIIYRIKTTNTQQEFSILLDRA